MCRILGAIGRKLDSPFISNVFLESEHLGKDATGFWFPNTNIVKQPKKVSEFLPEVKEVFEEGIKESHIFIGHTRYATHGKPEFNYNNHPIESENWIVVHNGIVSSMRDINEYQYTTDTDTENILAYIETFGVEKGLEYCTSGAAIILVNKKEKNTLYLWRTTTADMAIAYDIDKENIYISSGPKYFWSALKSEIKAVERLGGLFSVVERRIKIVEPVARELWKVTYKNKKLQAEKVAEITSRWSSNYNRGSYYTGGCFYTPPVTRDEADGLFAALCCGKNRPAIKEGRVKLIERTTTTTNTQKTTPKSVTKTTDNGNQDRIYQGDVVRFKRALEPTDIVCSQKQGLVSTLTEDMEFLTKKQLTDGRWVLERYDGEIFTAPTKLLETVAPPYCFGVQYSTYSHKCKLCLFDETCSSLHDVHRDTPKPPCMGKYNTYDEDCMKCTFLTYCLGQTEHKGYIDAEFTEVNEALMKEN